MNRRVALVALATVAATGVAIAQEKKKSEPSPDEAQATIDANKVAVCEKGKTFLSEQKAKGKCVAEADAAAKVTCSPATSKQVSALMTKCTSPKPSQKK